MAFLYYVRQPPAIDGRIQFLVFVGVFTVSSIGSDDRVRGVPCP